MPIGLLVEHEHGVLHLGDKEKSNERKITSVIVVSSFLTISPQNQGHVSVSCWVMIVFHISLCSSYWALWNGFGIVQKWVSFQSLIDLINSIQFFFLEIKLGRGRWTQTRSRFLLDRELEPDLKKKKTTTTVSTEKKLEGNRRKVYRRTRKKP